MASQTISAAGPSCPTRSDHSDRVLLGHGGGGRLTQRLLRDVIQPAWPHTSIVSGLDGATLTDLFRESTARHIVMSTDSFVVSPIFFPGGDIGSLAVTGTVNDLAMCGARPRYLSVGLILEEGLPFATLERIVASMRTTAEKAGVTVVTGDTKVVERGKADQIFINTTGIGTVEHPIELGPEMMRSGDVVLISGDIGRHGIAIMAERADLHIQVGVPSDCAPVHETVGRLLEAGLTPRCFRDPTRGGVAAALNELAEQADLTIRLRENHIPVHHGVEAVCELLGLDPLHVACEGRLITVVPAEQADQALAILARGPGGERATVIGEVVEEGVRPVIVETAFGTERIVDIPSGTQLPRIC